MHLVVLYLLLFCRGAIPFNVDIKQTNSKYLLSPTINSNSNLASTETSSSFFGYALKYTSSSDSFSLIITAPKTTDASNLALQTAEDNLNSLPQGRVEKCPLDFTSSNSKCSTIRLPEPKSGDTFGMSLEASETPTACSPAKLQNCSTAAFTPGYCYRSYDAGRTWSEFEERKECPHSGLDIMFVLDGSGSVNINNFEIVKEWTANLSMAFELSNDNARIGVVQYSHYNSLQSLDKQENIKTEIPLGRYNNHGELKKAILDIQYQGFTTATAHALNKTILDFKSSDRYSTARKIIILLTDGAATDGELLPETSEYVRSLGIIPFAVGVGQYNANELKVIATGTTTSERVFEVNNFARLNDIISRLKTEIMTFTLEGYGSTQDSSYGYQLGEVGFSMSSGKKLIILHWYDTSYYVCLNCTT